MPETDLEAARDAIRYLRGPADEVIAALEAAAIQPYREALEDALSLIEQAAPGAYANGVTDQSGALDEGEARAFTVVQAIRALLRPKEAPHA